MAEYGPGLTMGRCFSLDKERIKHALNGELMCGENEDGEFEYELATKAECDRYIISAFDNAVYQALSANASGRALDTILRRHGIEPSVQEYMEFLEEEKLRYAEDYEYEEEEDGGDNG